MIYKIGPSDGSVVLESEDGQLSGLTTLQVSKKEWGFEPGIFCSSGRCNDHFAGQ
jgi:hypothetical protein